METSIQKKFFIAALATLCTITPCMHATPNISLLNINKNMIRYPLYMTPVIIGTTAIIYFLHTYKKSTQKTTTPKVQSLQKKQERLSVEINRNQNTISFNFN